MSVTYTEEQARAIAARGKVIVSASAGSGKTFVMIERLVSLILGGADVREVLAVTFTNKAAAQMREKLRSALLKKIGETDGEERARLKDQLNALPMAEISTIHAFCGRLVRANFYLAGVDAAFRIVSPDDSDGQELSARAMEETFENAYAEGGEAFRRLLSVYFRKKKDARLRSAVASLHRKFRGLSEYREKLAAVGKESLFEEACAYLAEDYRTRAREIAESAEELAPCFDGRSAKAGAVCADVLGAARELLERDDLFALCALPAPNISRMPPTTRAVGEEAVRLKRLSALSKRIKALYSELRVYGSREEEEARCRDAEELAAALAELTLRYDGIYERLKAERGVLDYDDLEHFALKVLSDGDALAAVRERYKYLFVDEYQDVNPAQEKLLSLVGGEEIFLVGDRKQSIYGFRGSKSEYFTQKTEAFGQTLCLTENFRSAAAVLDAVNRVFTRAMTPSVCGFSYAENLLRGGRRYGTHEGSVCFHLIPTEKREKQPPAEVYSVCADQTAKKRDAQAEEIVRIVREELGSAIFDADLGEERRVRLGDVAVLVRKTTGDAERVVAALSDCGIPVTATAKVNLCEFREIRLLLDWLSYLDNAEQDVPFAAALRSGIGGLDEEALAKIRLRFPSAWYFRTACREYAEKMADDTARKLNDFFAFSARLRAQCAVRTAGEILGILLSEGLEAEISAGKDGARRVQRVRRLIAEAEGSVHAFLLRLSRAGNRIDYSEIGGEGAVKVLTMHASKGLEFPVVILASMDAAFHGADRDEIMWTEKFSVAPKSYDTGRKLVYETVVRRASAVYEERESVKDELNLLYVAMTRAQYRLHAVFGERGDYAPVRYAERFSDFIDMDDCAAYFTQSDRSEAAPAERRALISRPSERLKREILDVYRKPYPYEQSTRLPVKSSATQLLREKERVLRFDGQAERSADELFRADETDASGVSPETGIAYHAFLEHVDFSADASSELARMRRENLLTEEQASLLDPGKLEEILSVPCLRALAGKRVYREQKFLVALQADEVSDTEATDEIVFQGAIDLLCEDERGYTIIDYKFSSHDDERLRADYAPQIALYRKAAARILGVDERTIRARIVNIRRGREIEM